MTDPSTATRKPSRQRFFVLIVLALMLVTGSFFLTNKKEIETIIVTFPSGREIEAEVADTPEKLLFGLAFREGLPPNTGMLYIFEASGPHRMRTTGFTVPVDMIWVDETRHVVSMVATAAPCPKEPCPLYGPPPQDARYVIQTAAGFLHTEQLQAGAELKFTLRL
jgi:uncharacterized membrane protein (UPF0127 family)